MDIEQLRKQRQEDQELFLKYFSREVLQIDDIGLSVQRKIRETFDLIEEMEGKKSDFSIPQLIYSIDQLIAGYELLKNQLTEIKYRAKLQHQYIYRDQDKE